MIHHKRFVSMVIVLTFLVLVAFAACAPSGNNGAAVPQPTKIPVTPSGKNGTSLPQPARVPVTPINRPGIVVVDVAPVRSGPGAGYPRITALGRGIQVTVVGESPDPQAAERKWYFVKVAGFENREDFWVATEFVEFATPSAAAMPTSPASDGVVAVTPGVTASVAASGPPLLVTVTPGVMVAGGPMPTTETALLPVTPPPNTPPAMSLMFYMIKIAISPGSGNPFVLPVLRNVILPVLPGSIQYEVQNLIPIATQTPVPKSIPFATLGPVVPAIPFSTPVRVVTAIPFSTPFPVATPVPFSTPFRVITLIPFSTPFRVITPIPFSTPFRVITPIPFSTPFRVITLIPFSTPFRVVTMVPYYPPFPVVTVVPYYPPVPAVTLIPVPPQYPIVITPRFILITPPPGS
jgi:hypothetical protein